MYKLFPQKIIKSQVQAALLSLQPGQSAECSYSDFNILSVRTIIARLNKKGYKFKVAPVQGDAFFIVYRNK